MSLDNSIEELKNDKAKTTFSDVVDQLVSEKEHIAFFKDLSDEEIKILLKNVVLKRFVPNEMIFSQGDNFDNYIYYLLDGSVNILVKGDEGILKKVAILDQETLLGEMKPILDEGRTATCIAGNKGSIAIGFVIEQNDILNAHIYAKFYKNMSKILGIKLKELNIEIEIEDTNCQNDEESSLFYRNLAYKMAKTIQESNKIGKYKTN